MRYVALSTDANPHYAIYAPLVVRFWRRLGYEPILVTHNDGWLTPLGQHVLAHLEGTQRVEIPRIEPLSIGNTMRVARLAVAAEPHIADTDLVLTADIDMAPLSRTFWGRDGWDAFVLRADMYGSLAGCAVDPGSWNRLYDGRPSLLCGHFRFPLCYVGLRASLWRQVMPLTVGDIQGSMRRINHGLRHDSVEHDEATLSARMLHFGGLALGPLEHVAGDHWRQDQLQLVTHTNWPGGYPRGMLIGGAANGAAKDPAVIDFHMPKPTSQWVGHTLAIYWPEERDFIQSYWAEACKRAGVTQ